MKNTRTNRELDLLVQEIKEGLTFKSRLKALPDNPIWTVGDIYSPAMYLNNERSSLILVEFGQYGKPTTSSVVVDHRVIEILFYAICPEELLIKNGKYRMDSQMANVVSGLYDAQIFVERIVSDFYNERRIGTFHSIKGLEYPKEITYKKRNGLYHKLVGEAAIKSFIHYFLPKYLTSQIPLTNLVMEGGDSYISKKVCEIQKIRQMISKIENDTNYRTSELLLVDDSLFLGSEIFYPETIGFKQLSDVQKSILLSYMVGE